MSKLELWFPIKPIKINQLFGVANPIYAQNGIQIDGHNGIDYGATDGQNIHAAHDGIVTFAGYDGSGGLGIVIRTTEEFDYGDSKSYFKTIYWHLKEGSLKVKASDSVIAGQVIAGADNTGLSTGTHLHFGLKPIAKGENDWTWFNVEQNNGKLGAIDPTPYFNGYFAEDRNFVIGTLLMIIDLIKGALKIKNGNIK